MSTSSHYLSTAQAGERLGISREHVRRLIQQGELRAEETVNGFMVNMDEVERFAMERQVQRDHREFRLAVNDLAVKVRHVEGATTLESVVASLRDEAKLRSAFELSNAVTTQMEWMNQQVAANAAFAALQEPIKAVTEQWRRMADDADRVLKNVVDHDNHIKATTADSLAGQTVKIDAQLAQPTATKALIEPLTTSQKALQRAVALMPDVTKQDFLDRQDNISAAWKQENEHLANIRRDMGQVKTNPVDVGTWAAESHRQQEAAVANTQFAQVHSNAFAMETVATASKHLEEVRKSDWQPRKEDVTTTVKSSALSAVRNEEMARGFVIPEPREARLEQKVDELSRKVEQLTELVAQQRVEAETEAPTWEQWAGSDRPEDVLAKLAAIREEITGGKQADENSTDVIREAREARGGDT